MTRAQQHDELVVVATYNYRHEAAVGRSMLEANGVDAVINADDFGGVRPVLGVVNGVRLLVKRQDEREARQLLKV
jgi:hypothetical protein